MYTFKERVLAKQKTLEQNAPIISCKVKSCENVSTSNETNLCIKHYTTICIEKNCTNKKESSSILMKDGPITMCVFHECHKRLKYNEEVNNGEV